MSIVDRKVREKEVLKVLILKGVKKFFVEKGIEQIIIRNIVEEINYSVGIVYVYFKDKNDILYDFYIIGFQELYNYFIDLYNIENLKERLKKMGFIYIKFVFENFEMYDLMFNLKVLIEFLKECENDEWDEGCVVFELVKEIIKECIDKGYFKGYSVELLVFMVWSLVYGMCCLEIYQRIKNVNFMNLDMILYDGYNEYLKMIEKF